MTRRDIGAAQQRRDVVAVVGLQGDPDRGAELDGHAGDIEWAREGGMNAGGDLPQSAAVRQRGEHGELVAAEAGEEVAAAQHLAQAMGDLDQEPVALLVAERVVDLLEAIEVDQQQRRERAHALGARERALPLPMQGCAVRQVGEPVVGRLVAQPARGARDDAEEHQPEQQQAGSQREEEGARVAGDRLRGRLIGHVALEHAAADRDVDLEEATLGAQLLLAVLDRGVDLALDRLADVLVAAGVMSDERVVVRPDDAAAAVVELAAQQTARVEPMAEVGDALRRERTAVGLAGVQLARHADAGDGDGQAPGLVDGAMLDAGVQDRALHTRVRSAPRSALE
jgi:hypothetical protein